MTQLDSFNIQSRGWCDITDITPQVSSIVAGSDIKEGMALVFVAGSTAGITTIEYETGLLEDLKSAFRRLVPENTSYEHDSHWGDGNGFSHVRASLLGPAVTVPFGDGKLLLGTWQQIVLVDFDNRPRTRRVLVRIIGE